MKARRPLCIFIGIAASSALAAACSQGPDSTGRSSSAALDICVLDGAVCVDVPDVNVPPLPFDGGLPFGDASLPPLPDGGFQFPDVNIPPLPDAGFPQFDAGAGECNPFDPKYAEEFTQQLASGQTPTQCGSGCAANECCFLHVACVPQ